MNEEKKTKFSRQTFSPAGYLFCAKQKIPETKMGRTEDEEGKKLCFSQVSDLDFINQGNV